MRNRSAIDVWVVGFLASLASLLGVASMAMWLGFVDPTPFLHRGAAKPLAPQTPRAAVVQSHKDTSLAHSSPRPSIPKPAQNTIARRQYSGEAASSNRGSIAWAQQQKPIAQPGTPAAPERQVLKPIGFLQKADGSVEAVVSDEYGVQLVHQGDTYQEIFTVASVAEDSVELVSVSPNSHPRFEPLVVAAVPPRHVVGVPSDRASPSGSSPTTVPPNPPDPAVKSAERQPTSPKSVGSVAPVGEMVAAGEHPRGVLPDQTSTEARTTQNISLAQPGLTGSTEAAQTISQRSVAAPMVNLGSLAGLPAVGVPAPDPAFDRPPAVANDRRKRNESGSVMPDPWHPLERPPPDFRRTHAGRRVNADSLPARTSQEGSSGLDPPLAVATEERGPPANLSPDRPVMRVYGYVQWPDGRSLAVVDDGRGGVRLAEGREVVDELPRIAKADPEAGPKADVEADKIAELPFAPSRAGRLVVLDAGAPIAVSIQEAPQSLWEPAPTEETAGAERPKHPPRDSNTNPCAQQQQQPDEMAGEAQPPDAPTPGGQQLEETVAADSPLPPGQTIDSIPGGRRIEAHPTSPWNLLAPRGSVLIFRILPSAANADANPLPWSASSLAASPGSGLGTGTSNAHILAPSSGCPALGNPIP